MPKKGKRRQNYNYIDEFIEWQDHKNIPGYYTGGKMPPWVYSLGRPLLGAFMWFFFAGVSLIIEIAIADSVLFKGEKVGGYASPLIIFGLMTCLYAALGIRSYNKHKTRKKRGSRKTSAKKTYHLKRK